MGISKRSAFNVSDSPTVFDTPVNFFGSLESSVNVTIKVTSFPNDVTFTWPVSVQSETTHFENDVSTSTARITVREPLRSYTVEMRNGANLVTMHNFTVLLKSKFLPSKKVNDKIFYKTTQGVPVTDGSEQPDFTLS